ncbi:MAG: hypothetical protein V1912_13410 [bacterium]
MGYSVSITPDAESGSLSLVLRVSLTRAESNDLFLSGDSMLGWPVEGLEQNGDPKLERSGMFISEVAARPSGLTIRYSRRDQAERAAALLRMQLANVGIEEES